MPFKLLVRKTDDPAPQPDAYVFHQQRATIGRDGANELPLNDTKRVVSKQHAEITQQGVQYFVKDLGSKNFTYLNGNRIESGKPREIYTGDVIRIGEFEITFDVVAEMQERPAVPDYDRTVFDASFQNPFEEDVQLLGAALRSMRKNYDQALPVRRDDALQEAIQSVMEGEDRHEAYQLVGEMLGGPGAAPQSTPPTFSSPTSAPSPVNPPPAPPRPTPPTEPSHAAIPLDADAPRLHRVLHTVLNVAAKLVSGPWQFRHEFIGQTIARPGDTDFIYQGSPDMLKRHLLDPAIPEEEADERLALLEKALDDIAVHEVAMLDGYRAAALEGAQRLLDQIDPETIEAEVEKDGMQYKIDALAKAETLKRLKAHLHELRNEDWSSGERRIYRPAFIKAYLARMTERR
jgi:predicted component of type VI protein secretion system